MSRQNVRKPLPSRFVRTVPRPLLRAARAFPVQRSGRTARCYALDARTGADEQTSTEPAPCRRDEKGCDEKTISAKAPGKGRSGKHRPATPAAVRIQVVAPPRPSPNRQRPREPNAISPSAPISPTHIRQLGIGTPRDELRDLADELLNPISTGSSPHSSVITFEGA